MHSPGLPRLFRVLPVREAPFFIVSVFPIPDRIGVPPPLAGVGVQFLCRCHFLFTSLVLLYLRHFFGQASTSPVHGTTPLNSGYLVVRSATVASHMSASRRIHFSTWYYFKLFFKIILNFFIIVSCKEEKNNLSYSYN